MSKIRGVTVDTIYIDDYTDEPMRRVRKDNPRSKDKERTLRIKAERRSKQGVRYG